MKRMFPLFLGFVFLLNGCSLTGKEPGPLDPKGTTGEEQLTLILLSSGIMLLVMLIVFVLFFYIVVRFRKKKGDEEIPKQVEGNHKLEITWTVIPVLLLVILAIPSIAFTFSQAEDYAEDPDALLVKVTAHQFWWEFEYPEYELHTAQDLYLPVNTKVQFQLSASDVIHSFWIPGIGGKMDTLVGQTNTFYYEPTEIGVFRGKCVEFCGSGHALMDFKAHVVSEEDFEAWVESLKAPVETTEDAAAGEQIFGNACISCHAIDSSQASSGPNLDGFANRLTVGGYLENNEENLARWITDPQQVKLGASMPTLPLTEDEVQELVKYLNTLK